MNAHVRSLLDRIAALEEELSTELHNGDRRLGHRTLGSRVQFSPATRLAHRQQRMGLGRWLISIEPRNLLAIPFIYGMTLPLLVLDLGISLYQAICFPLFGVAKVRRHDFMAHDRHHLDYLNAIEKLNCTYCSYANGLLAYSREIAARTEQYFCPIKHSRQVAGNHARYARFLEYGDPIEFHARVERLRRELAAERSRRRESQASH